MIRRPLLIAAGIAASITFAPAELAAQTRLYYDQTYYPASHNWVFSKSYPRADRLFNAFDYGHSILYETLWRDPAAKADALDVREYDFITKRLFVSPPSVPLDESAIGPDWTRLAPEVHAMFDWAHMLHRQLYDVLADDRMKPAAQQAEIARLVTYYKSRPALAFSSKPKDMDLMEGQSYSLAFRKRFPKYNGLIWSYHWMQMTIYDALMAATSSAERKSNVTAVVDRFWSMVNGPAEGLPTVMPMSAAIAPTFSETYTEAAIIFDNLHSLHDVVSDILANPNVPRSRKRSAILEAAKKYRDLTSNVTTVEEWRSMSAEMGLAEMGGAAPIGNRQTPKSVAPGHKH
ncbi:MAG TPA: hypothetical protein VM939_03585 [Gemmatimonadaceae bacterium]|nr:hypothetical protein [Gemmatimonadaceae bacterium]